MGLKYEYPGGVTQAETPLLERFEEEIVPYIQAHGPRIGEEAMFGDENSTNIIQRYRMVVEGLPEMRGFNYRLLLKALQKRERGLQ